MDVKFKMMKVRNFMSFRELDFDFSSFGRRTILVSGNNLDVAGTDSRNGAGKSTVFSALVFAIYGEPLNPVKGAHISNWNSKLSDDVHVELEVESGGHAYRIIRVLSGRRKAQTLNVVCDGEDATRSTIAETQRLIETDVVPCGKDGFLRCIYLTADQNCNFFKLPKAAKNDFFESLFELGVYSDMYSLLHRETLDESAKLIAASRTTDQLAQNVEKLKAEREASIKDVAEMKEAEAAQERAEAELAEYVRTSGIEFDGSGAPIVKTPKEYDECVAKGKALVERVRNGNRIVSQLRAEIASLTSAASPDSPAIRGAESAIRRYDGILSSHTAMVEKLCEKCSPIYREKFDYDGVLAQKREAEAELETLKAQSQEASAKLAVEKAKCARYQEGIDALAKQVEELRAEATRLKADGTTVVAKYNVLKGAVDTAAYKLKLLSESKTKTYDAPIASLSESLEASRSEFRTLDRIVAEHKALESIIKPENIRKHVVADMLKELNFRICGYLSKMGSNYTCEFDEDFEATFTSSTGREAEYNNFSSGEKMRLGIACCFAFKDFMQVRLNIRSNILVIDEYIDSNLDPLAVNGIMELIRYMVASEGLAAFIISHRSEVLDSASDGTMLVVKKDNESRIEFGGCIADTAKEGQ